MMVVNTPATVTIRDSYGNVFEATVVSYTISINHTSPLKKFSIEAVENYKSLQGCAHQWKMHSGLNAIDESYVGIGQSYEKCDKCGETR